jgi:hypothetical protein
MHQHIVYVWMHTNTYEPKKSQNDLNIDRKMKLKHQYIHTENQRRNITECSIYFPRRSSRKLS